MRRAVAGKQRAIPFPTSTPLPIHLYWLHETAGQCSQLSIGNTYRELSVLDNGDAVARENVLRGPRDEVLTLKPANPLKLGLAARRWAWISQGSDRRHVIYTSVGRRDVET